MLCPPIPNKLNAEAVPVPNNGLDQNFSKIFPYMTSLYVNGLSLSTNLAIMTCVTSILLKIIQIIKIANIAARHILHIGALLAFYKQ